MHENLSSLPQGYILNNQYRIERPLGSGTIGMTYLATDIGLGRSVVIKELFPKEICRRDILTSEIQVQTHDKAGLFSSLKSRFLKTARKIARLDSPNIIHIISAFEANNTVYSVMDLIEGQNLRDIVKSKGVLSPEQANTYIQKIGSAIDFLHSHKINHLDIKPSNILVSKSDDRIILTDFGLAHDYDDNGLPLFPSTLGVSHGFAPKEQYNAKSLRDFSPATDVYALAATYYFLIFGTNPPNAFQLLGSTLNFPGHVSQNIQDILTRAMSTDKLERPQSVDEFVTELTGQRLNPIQSPSIHPQEPDVKPSPIPSVITPTPPKPISIPKAVKSTPRPKPVKISDPTPKPVKISSTPTDRKQGPNLKGAYIYSAIVIGILALLCVGLWLWNSKNSNSSSVYTYTGTAKEADYSHTPVDAGDAVPEQNNYGGHEWVNLGLSVNWATCNLGADSPSDFGQYYAWGETSPGFNWDYYSSSNSICGNPNYDAATKEWGSGWRMPTAEECKELLNECHWKWTTLNSTPGYKVTGPNGNSIFLPAAGYYKNADLEFDYTNGNYWSGTPKGTNKAYYISFHSSYKERRAKEKDRARSIRPVRD